ncbi:PQ-loop domain-containing transporter [Mycoplasmopsis lipofaciens]|uniref:PQ-loop domain-containing transporter n=1 Tax=Mycoplasmopsis lipofaciens TaxID=114884 RepID=UPI00068ED0DA|nr:PQ-loop domain-containing transporter [Mycoplasmopsis lipofaciens]
MFKAFGLQEGGWIWAGWMAIFFGIVSSIITAIVTLPQLIKLIKTKEVGNVKYYSFWIFFVALLLWIIIGSFDQNWERKITASYFANVVCSLIYSLVLFFMYRYSKNKYRNKMQWIVLGLTLFLSLGLSSAGAVGIWANNGQYHVDKYTMSILMQIAPMLTTFAFLPQILKSFENKDFSGLSKFMIFLFVVANILWVCYWISMALYNKELSTTLLTATIWQLMSLGIYISTLSYMLKSTKKEKEVQNNV